MFQHHAAADGIEGSRGEGKFLHLAADEGVGAVDGLTLREQPLEDIYTNCVQVGDRLHPLLSRDAAVRTYPWLLEQYDKQGAARLVGQYAGTLRAVEVPADVSWTIWENEDGTEAVHEVHRVWA